MDTTDAKLHFDDYANPSLNIKKTKKEKKKNSKVFINAKFNGCLPMIWITVVTYKFSNTINNLPINITVVKMIHMDIKYGTFSHHYNYKKNTFSKVFKISRKLLIGKSPLKTVSVPYFYICS